eukprot:CAMPEP_0178425110 /NCGR_PEP_ID=MMETSP0689_2-20121128/28554_1 /TAXON_ID=160604 /ORGANISM="Amphidinium massartii, Strain CS-259" /LENGTH=456 /DNA_ID=CAMNT_0020046763 /DNA_START=1 /DNA_END=1371 /DNA_ORIENTATION=+
MGMGLTQAGDYKVRTSIRPGHMPRECSTAEEALEPYLHSKGMVFIQGGGATPQPLIDGMIKVAKTKKLRNLYTIHMHLEGPGPLPADDPEAAECITPIATFIGANLRNPIAEGDALYMPIYLRDLPMLFRRRAVEPDVCLLQCSPPDAHGYCTLGVSVDWSRSAAEHGKALVAVINPKMPRVHGDGAIHYSQFDAVIHREQPMWPHAFKELLPEEIDIGRHIAKLVPDGATLQMGIGSVPDAALAQLGNHKNLGIHTEMFSDGVLPLMESGVINNSMKSTYRGRTISSFVVGSQKVYDFVEDNPSVNLKDVAYTNNVEVIASQNTMIGINSCIEMDITGQAASGSIGKKIYSGFGGQVDFLTGATACPDGKGILAMPSRSKKGASRIVPQLQHAAGVVTTRAMVQYVVTEHGVVNLFGKTLPERARLLIDIAHPDDREMLEKNAYERFGKAFIMFR